VLAISIPRSEPAIIRHFQARIAVRVIRAGGLLGEQFPQRVLLLVDAAAAMAAYLVVLLGWSWHYGHGLAMGSDADVTV
jgi:hypothetical protein